MREVERKIKTKKVLNFDMRVFYLKMEKNKLRI
jgi:hypothetical protein